jgi:4-hydroxy-3-polyprenylbenzoate decarboxylase
VQRIASEVSGSGLIRGIRYLVFLDPEAAALDAGSVTWLAANNIDPMRDCYLARTSAEGPPVFVIDATSKISGTDDFAREWPNIILMDDMTISAVDRKWSSLGLGPLLPSPSVKFKPLVQNPGAVAWKEQKNTT